MTQLAETLDAPPESAASIFQREWRLYRKIVDHNYIFHHEAYTRLRKALVEEATRPFRFLDLACGDAGLIAEALRGVEVASYFGVDLSAEGLRLASQALGVSCVATAGRLCGDPCDARRAGRRHLDRAIVAPSARACKVEGDASGPEAARRTRDAACV